MLLVLLSVVLLALSSAQSTDNDVNYEDFTFTIPATTTPTRTPSTLSTPISFCQPAGSIIILPEGQTSKTSPGATTLVI
ncbi:proline rich 4 [Homo sapiens]|uniref:Proline rich 4 n=1 Tax=Homo sapiens TaxID=9606 RepID=F5H178_HUMAN|nr:proline rich 4 [Homo sapiens]KAI4064716.1 proline rich 4 [Homo sapiens]